MISVREERGITEEDLVVNIQLIIKSPTPRDLEDIEFIKFMVDRTAGIYLDIERPRGIVQNHGIIQTETTQISPRAIIKIIFDRMIAIFDQRRI